MNHIQLAAFTLTIFGIASTAWAQVQEIPMQHQISQLQFDKGYLWAFDDSTGWLSRIIPGNSTGGEMQSFPGASKFLVDGDTVWIAYRDGRIESNSWGTRSVVRSLRSAGSDGFPVNLVLQGPYVAVTLRLTHGYHICTQVDRDGDCVLKVAIIENLAVYSRANGELVNSIAVYYGVEITKPGGYVTNGWLSSVHFSGSEWLDMTFSTSKVVRLPFQLAPEPTIRQGDTVMFDSAIASQAGYTLGNSTPLTVGDSVYALSSTGEPFSMDLSTKVVTAYRQVPGATGFVFDNSQIWVKGPSSTETLTPAGGRVRKVIPVVDPGTMAFDGRNTWVPDPSTGTIRPF